MNPLQRASKLLETDVNHLLDSAEDPEVSVERLIHEMDEAVRDLRRETVNAVARQKRLERKAGAERALAAELEEKALLVLERRNRPLLRKILDQRVEALKRHESLLEESRSATELARRIKTDLLRMEAQATTARQTRDELICRNRFETRKPSPGEVEADRGFPAPV